MVKLRADAKDPVLTSEAATDADLADAQAETWREGFLRHGLLGVGLVDLTFDPVPIFSSDTSNAACLGFALEATGPNGHQHRQVFGLAALQDVAQRAADRLVGLAVLAQGQKYFYEVAVGPETAEAVPASDADALLEVTVKSPPAHFLVVPVRPLLEQARPVNLHGDAKEFPVFFTASAFQAAQRYSRKGAAAHPPVETGAALFGPLCTCPETHELFPVITDALEIGGEQKPFSLAYSSQCWGRIQAVLRARQQSQPAYRLLSQCHGHNFAVASLLADGGKACETCEKKAACGVTTVFVSQDDKLFTRALFHGQPWAHSMVFGHNVRGETACGLFALHEGRLRERGFYVLPEFDSEPFATKSARDF